MAEPETLPERLQYLQPYREFLGKLRKSEVGDGTDTTLLEELIYEQIHGKTVEEAKEKLSADLEELEKYLSVPVRRNDRLHFVLGYFLIAAEDPAELLKRPEKPKPVEEKLVMDLPPKTKPETSEGWPSLNVEWKEESFYAHKCRMDDDFQAKKVMVEFNNPNATAYEHFILRGEPGMAEMIPKAAREKRRQSISVDLGEVKGHKYVSTGAAPATWQRVDFLLQVPGGYVQGTIQASVLFDESKWDPYLKTLRLEKVAA
ncbi:MAG TPA: hypothetical protein VNU95_09465 [Candidatus Acidoferrales bacterium]|jgi:hypothetical protein|nr:hypothetical protein [Candidatus Acidoferrales bacterium]